MRGKVRRSRQPIDREVRSSPKSGQSICAGSAWHHDALRYESPHV